MKTNMDVYLLCSPCSYIPRLLVVRKQDEIKMTLAYGVDIGVNLGPKLGMVLKTDIT